MEITLLDGSIGQEIVKRSNEEPTTLWSTKAMITNPEIVEQVHDMYFEAGATVATTNTYSALKERLEKVNLEEQRFDLWKTAIAAADRSRRKNKSGKIAGAIGPLYASYRPDLCPPPVEAAEMYREIVDALDPECDIILVETMSSLNQTEGALLATADTMQPVWIGLTVDDYDGTIFRSGEKLIDVRPLLEKYSPAAVLINCSRPEVVAEAVSIVAKFGFPCGAYANGFTEITQEFLSPNPTVASLTSREELSPAMYADFAMHWIDQGATIVGGCCEVGPEHIQELHTRLIQEGHQVV